MYVLALYVKMKLTKISQDNAPLIPAKRRRQHELDDNVESDTATIPIQTRRRDAAVLRRRQVAISDDDNPEEERQDEDVRDADGADESTVIQIRTQIRFSSARRLQRIVGSDDEEEQQRKNIDGAEGNAPSRKLSGYYCYTTLHNVRSEC